MVRVVLNQPRQLAPHCESEGAISVHFYVDGMRKAKGARPSRCASKDPSKQATPGSTQYLTNTGTLSVRH